MNYPIRRTIRLSPELDAAMRAKAAQSEDDISDFIRTAIKHAVMDYRAPTHADLVQFNHLCRVLDGAAANINQLARAANQARLGHGTMPEVAEMEKAAVRVDKIGNQILRILRMWL